MILVAAGSPDGEAIASTLRTQGLHVVEVPLSALQARVVDLSPRVILVDVDQPGAVSALGEVREHLEGQNAQILCIGDSSHLADLAIGAVQAFDKPVDLEQLTAEVADLVGPAAQRSRSREPRAARISPVPFHARESPPSTSPLRSDRLLDVGLRSLPILSDVPSAPDRLDLGSLLPGSSGARSSSPIPTQLSPELERLLAAAESQVSSEESIPSIRVPSPQEEVDLILSPEFLSALDDPLDPPEQEEEEDLLTGSEYRLNLGNEPAARGSGALLPPGAMQGAPSTRSSDALATMGTVALGFGESATPTGVRIPGDTFGTSAGKTRADSKPPVGAREAQGLDPLQNLRLPQPPRILDDVPQAEHATPPLQRHPAASPLPPAAVEPPQVPVEPRAGPVPPSAPPLRPASAPAIFPPALAAPPAPQLPPVAAFAAAAAPVHARRERELEGGLTDGDFPRALARAIAGRFSGSLAITGGTGTRRIVFHEGDIVTAGSELAGETLIAFLAARGDLHRDVAARLAGRLAPSGKHAGAALIAQGHLAQDDLWPVLRAHAEWIIGMAMMTDTGTVELEAEPPGRLRTEPSVFGGAAGAEVFVEVLRRVLTPSVALQRLGGVEVRIDHGPQFSLLAECALAPNEASRVTEASARRLADVLVGSDPELVNVLYALVCLDVLSTLAAPRAEEPSQSLASDPLDAEAIRSRVRARMALVEDGDYFALLGISHTATSYEIRRAYLALRRSFEPSQILTGATVDLTADVRTVMEVLDEAYDILRDPNRRERYRRAIEAPPP